MYFLTQGIVFGVYAAFLPGPMQAFLLSEVIRNGWKKTLPLALIPLGSDGPIMLSLFLLLSQLPDWFTQVLRVVGGFFILYLAWDAYHSSDKINLEKEALEVKPAQSLTFFKGVTMNLLNPNVYIFWATIGVPTILTGWEISPWHGIAFAVGFYVVMISVTMGWIAVFGTVGYLKPSIQKVISWIIVAMLIIVGLSMIIGGLRTWL